MIFSPPRGGPRTPHVKILRGWGVRGSRSHRFGQPVWSKTLTYLNSTNFLHTTVDFGDCNLMCVCVCVRAEVKQAPAWPPHAEPEA